jgi:hypothetical protein
MQGRGRKHGSILLAILMGISLLGLALGIYIGDFRIKDHQRSINIGTCIFFALILFWWAFSEGKSWGIGFETITMTVTVIVAVIAVLTLTAL